MRINIDENNIRVELHGREQIWAFRAKIVIPRKNITALRFEKSFKEWRKIEVRMPGTSVPGHLLAGSYWTDKGWDFLYVKNPSGFLRPTISNVLVIETDQNRFSRIIVSYSKKDADKLLDWWNKSR